MNSRLIWQQFKLLLFVHSIFALLLATTGKAYAVDITKTDYSIPSGAYFVSASGSDSNSGKAPNSPWTVAKALKSAPSGATIVFRGGTYRNVNNLGITKRLTLQAYPNEKAWIKGSVVVTDWDRDGNIWRKDGWKHSFSPPWYMTSVYYDPKYPLAGRGDMVYINGVALKQVASKAKVVAGTFYVDAGNDKLYIGNNPAGKTVESTAKEKAFGFWSTNASNSIVRGLGFAHYANTAVDIVIPSVKLEKNTFAWNGLYGAKLRGRDNVVIGNTFSYNGAQGLGVEQAARVQVKNNKFSYNNTERFIRNWLAAGVKIIRTDGAVVSGNIVEHNLASGIWLDVSVTNAKIVNNISKYNDGAGIFFELSHKAIIAANVSYNNRDGGVVVSNSSSAKVYNNTLVNNGSANLRLRDTRRNNKNKAEIAAGITWIARNNVFKNNILSNSTGGSLLDASNCDTKEPASRTVSSSDHNAYYRRSSSKPKDAVKWSLGSTCSAGYTSTDAFNAATGYEDHALTIDNTSTNPFFVNEAGGDYRLKSGSQAIGRGTALPSDIANAIGVRSGVPVDLGALQSKTVLAQSTQEDKGKLGKLSRLISLNFYLFSLM